MSLEDEDVAASAEGGLEGDLPEFLHDVANISAKLLNSPLTPHVFLKELLRVPGQVPEDLAALATEPRTRQDWTVTVEDYGEGTLTLRG